MNTSATSSHRIAASCWIALIILTIIWDWVYAPLHTGRGLLLLKLLPLSLPLRGIIFGRVYTYQYCSMLILAYFTEGIMRLFDAETLSVVFATAEVALSVSFFIFCLLYVKQFKRPKSAEAENQHV